MTRHYQRNSGFTIIELMLAMVFISFLLLAIAGVVMQIGAIYNKGVTMKSVNQAGSQIVADIKRTIGSSQVFDTTTSFKSDVAGGGGRLCTGTYTYVWNYGVLTKYHYVGNPKPLRFVRFQDNGGQYCQLPEKTQVQEADATELLSQVELAIQGFEIKKVTVDDTGGMAVYNLSIIISNADQSYIDTVASQCKPPSDGGQQDFCAVNQFDFTARTGDKGASK